MKIKPRRDAVAAAANCNRLAPIAATEAAVWRDLLPIMPRKVLEVICRRDGYYTHQCFYWKHEGVYYYDDAKWGNVVPVKSLDYSDDKGLFVKPDKED